LPRLPVGSELTAAQLLKEKLEAFGGPHVEGLPSREDLKASIGRLEVAKRERDVAYSALSDIERRYVADKLKSELEEDDGN
jgi:hypothetical protein